MDVINVRIQTVTDQVNKLKSTHAKLLLHNAAVCMTASSMTDTLRTMAFIGSSAPSVKGEDGEE
jgi:hypothetical protein